MNVQQQALYDRQIATWLLVCAAVIFGMILLGGVTRLTGSGLSMVEWRPLMGIIPPLSEAAWLDVFEKYKQYPEYQKVNLGMDLAGFKVIFMYEYLHRVLGRLIGTLYFVPFAYFLWKGMVRPDMKARLWLLFVLGGLQGLLGWYMVKSGLVDNPRVSQYRLTSHLGLAFAIYAYMIWLALDLLTSRGERTELRWGGMATWSAILVGLVYLMILTGGLVAGTRAGFAYNTWPLMGTSFIPDMVYSGASAWRDAFEDITTIQFNHRMFAYILSAMIVATAISVYRSRYAGGARRAVSLLLLALAGQVVLGISTLLLHVPISLAAAHQGGAVVLLSAVIYFAHVMLRHADAVKEALPELRPRIV
ncbi:MAG: COX15/CtaA family protein [Pseudomonadota bacterium]